MTPVAQVEPSVVKQKSTCLSTSAAPVAVAVRDTCIHIGVPYGPSTEFGEFEVKIAAVVEAVTVPPVPLRPVHPLAAEPLANPTAPLPPMSE